MGLFVFFSFGDITGPITAIIPSIFDCLKYAKKSSSVTKTTPLLTLKV
jgi:hypothetical protein